MPTEKVKLTVERFKVVKDVLDFRYKNLLEYGRLKMSGFTLSEKPRQSPLPSGEIIPFFAEKNGKHIVSINTDLIDTIEQSEVTTVLFQGMKGIQKIVFPTNILSKTISEDQKDRFYVKDATFFYGKDGMVLSIETFTDGSINEQRISYKDARGNRFQHQKPEEIELELFEAICKSFDCQL